MCSYHSTWVKFGSKNLFIWLPLSSVIEIDFYILENITIRHILTCFFSHFVFCQMGFFRRHYRERIEAEKNRKDSDESWDWVQKSEWKPEVVSDDPLSCYLHHSHVLRPTIHIVFHMWKRIFSKFFGALTLFFVGREMDIWHDDMVHQIWHVVEFHTIPKEVAVCQLEHRDGRKATEAST